MTDRDSDRPTPPAGYEPADQKMRLPPTMARMVEVASGLSNWTIVEKLWLEGHPKWAERELKLRAAIEDGKRQK